MKSFRPAYIVSGVRTGIGSYGGSLMGVGPSELGAVVLVEAVRRAGIGECDESSPIPVLKNLRAPIDAVVMGNVLGAGHGMNIARQASVRSGISVTTPAYTVNMVCGSGLHAVGLASLHIGSGEAELILAGGTESMSQAGYVSHSQRWGARMGHAELRDLMIQDGLTDAFLNCHMGITAENLAARYGISRQQQDSFALESQSRAGNAAQSGFFKEEIVSVPLLKKGKKVGAFDTDEYIRADSSLEKLGSLSPAFKKDGTVTAGNASGINDGAAALLIASEDAIKRFNLTPLAEIEACTRAGVEPEVMGIGPVEAVRKLLERTGSSIESFDWIEANEAFAVQALAVGKELGWSSEKVNPLGGAIALGHPIGASGARLLVTLLHQLKRTGGHRGLATLCVGGGQGIAMAVKRL